MESLLAGYVIGNYLIKYMVVNGRGWSVVEREPCTKLKCKFKVELHVLENPRDSCKILTNSEKMTTAQAVETSVTVNNNSPIQEFAHPDDQTQPIF